MSRILNADMAPAYRSRGLSFYYRRNLKRAFRDLQKAHRLDPKMPDVRKQLQMVMRAIKRQEKG